MKKKLFDKSFPLTARISGAYDAQARAYQKEYNRMHPDAHIWRHALYRRTFSFFVGGAHIKVSVEIVRFIYAATNKTMTFYGSLFIPFMHFSRQFMTLASRNPDRAPAIEVASRTVARWSKFLKLHKPEGGKILRGAS